MRLERVQHLVNGDILDLHGRRKERNGSLALVPQDWDKSEKFLFYCALIIRHSDFEEELRTEQSISALAEFLYSAESKRRNLNSLRYALLKKFGKDLGRRYYFLLKPYVKAMNQM